MLDSLDLRKGDLKRRRLMLRRTSLMDLMMLSRGRDIVPAAKKRNVDVQILQIIRVVQSLIRDGFPICAVKHGYCANYI